MTIREIYNSYIDYCELKMKPQSLRTTKSRFNNYIIPYIGKYEIDDFKPIQYLEWQKKMQNKGFKYSYLKSLHYSAVALFNFAINFYEISKNVPSIVGNFKNNYDNTEIKFWSYNEFSKFISCVDERMYKTFFSFLFWTGCRLGEALALTWEDLNENVISITKTISKESINGQRVTTTPKTKKSIRKIRIDAKLTEQLNELLTYYNKIYNNFNNKFYIFGGANPLAPTTIERKKNYYCKLSNVKQIRLHDFRHSHASLLLSNNVPITAIADRLGHSDINTTLNTYSHMLPEDEKRVINTLNSLKLNLTI